MPNLVVPRATQMEYPLRSALRTGGVALVTGLILASAASLILGPAFDQVLPGSGVGAWIVGAGASCGVLGAALDRVKNLPQFAALLTVLNLGPVPKAVAQAQAPISRDE